MGEKVNPHRLMKVLSEILSEMYDMKITITCRPKNAANDPDKAKTPAQEEEKPLA